MPKLSIVFDVGKTHVKVTVLDDQGQEQFSRRGRNKSVIQGGLPRLDTDGIWSWFTEQSRMIGTEFDVGSLAITTHGAAAVLLDERSGQPLAPPLDYEFAGYGETDEAYDKLRPPFEETYSPRLPAGLNLGRQLFFLLKGTAPEDLESLRILLYPNYWAWRLTGVQSSEVTSLGCHTDLWAPVKNDFSSLVDRLDLRSSFPPIVPASMPIGTLTAQSADECGLPESVSVLPGLHDSNAGYYPYLASPRESRPTVVSTGTWCIVCCPAADLQRLDPNKDMLANVDAEGNPVATARYMGGREFAEICELTNSDIATECTAQDIADVIASEAFALPGFGDGSGPFGQARGTIVGQPRNGKALATLYSALMLDQLLDNLGASGEIAIEGSFAKNDLLCRTLAALRPDQQVSQLPGAGGVVAGCFEALHGHSGLGDLKRTTQPLPLDDLMAYRLSWIASVGKHVG